MSAAKRPTKKSVAAKTPAKKPVAAKTPTKKSVAAKKPVADKKAAKKMVAKKASAKPVARRDDYGSPVDGYFAKQPPAQRAILEAFRALIVKAAPDASASLKWGQPFFALGEGMTGMVCALGAHKAHVNLILTGPEGTYADPKGLLEGTGKSGKRLTIRHVDEIPAQIVLGWLRTAVARAKKA